MTRRSHGIGRLLALLLALLLVGLGSAACSSDSGSDAASEAEADGGGIGTPAEDAPGEQGRDGVTADEGGAVDDGGTTVQRKAFISTGRVTLEGDDLVAVRSEIDRLLGRFGGFVADEQTYNDDEGRTVSSTLVLRVPGRHFEDMMTSFADFATVKSADRQAEDVSTEVIDVESRIRTQEVSLRRLRGFLGRAVDVDSMIRLESEIAQREATLESLKAQQEFLADQVSLATITVSMETPAEPAPEDDPLEDAGFMSGLRGGWEALLDVLLVGATVVGAVIPFAAVLAVLGVPLWLALRARRQRRRPPASPDA